jgi:hypothetical protein
VSVICRLRSELRKRSLHDLKAQGESKHPSRLHPVTDGSHEQAPKLEHREIGPLSSTEAKRNAGPTTTNGQNDMVLDNWGEVATWTATAPVTSHGPSGIGFVNLGAIGRLGVQAPIETFGPGARGFNLYDGSLEHASFQSIATHGDGSIGVQVSKHLPFLDIAGDLTTGGGEALSLVKGVQMQLKAIGLSVKPGGQIGALDVGGRIHTAGKTW